MHNCTMLVQQNDETFDSRRESEASFKTFLAWKRSWGSDCGADHFGSELSAGVTILFVFPHFNETGNIPDFRRPV